MLWLIIAIACFVNYVSWDCIDAIFRKWKGISFDFLQEFECVTLQTGVSIMDVMKFCSLCLCLQFAILISGAKNVFELNLLNAVILLGCNYNLCVKRLCKHCVVNDTLFEGRACLICCQDFFAQCLKFLPSVLHNVQYENYILVG